MGTKLKLGAATKKQIKEALGYKHPKCSEGAVTAISMIRIIGKECSYKV